MTLSYWPLDRASELAACYNRHTAAWPYCHPQTPTSFARGVKEDLGYLYGWKRDHLRDETLLATDESNHRAQLLYAANGYRVTHLTHSYTKPAPASQETAP